MGGGNKTVEYIQWKISRQELLIIYNIIDSPKAKDTLNSSNTKIEFVEVYATVAVDTYPQGINTWKVVNDGCHDHDEQYEVQLGLSVFNDSVFMCDDGRTVHMDKR